MDRQKVRTVFSGFEEKKVVRWWRFLSARQCRLFFSMEGPDRSSSTVNRSRRTPQVETGPRSRSPIDLHESISKRLASSPNKSDEQGMYLLAECKNCKGHCRRALLMAYELWCRRSVHVCLEIANQGFRLDQSCSLSLIISVRMEDESNHVGGRLQLHRVASTLDETILSPGAVKINVKGAFIVDEEPDDRTDSPIDEEGVQHDTRDIRLPNHQAVVSHVALDVRPALGASDLPAYLTPFR